MIKLQKIIKYLAIFFAASIICSIISGVMVLFYSMISNNKDLIDGRPAQALRQDIKYLDIEVKGVNIVFKEGNEFTFETTNENIKYQQNEEKLTIEEKKHNWFGKKDNNNLIIYIPYNYTFETIELEAGAGTINIGRLSANRLDLELGAGKVEITNLIVNNNTSIDSGAGTLTINNSLLNNLELDMGVGNVIVTSELKGVNEISAGVGKLELNLLGNDYKIKVDKGIGTTTISGNAISDNTYYGTGNNLIKIDGGIGKIEINYHEN